MQLIVHPNGALTCLYDEAIDLTVLGQLDIKRASHVEPDQHGQWYAQIIDGPKLGLYARRSEALDAERRWLEERQLC